MSGEMESYNYDEPTTPSPSGRPRKDRRTHKCKFHPTGEKRAFGILTEDTENYNLNEYVESILEELYILRCNNPKFEESDIVFHPEFYGKMISNFGSPYDLISYNCTDMFFFGMKIHMSTKVKGFLIIGSGEYR